VSASVRRTEERRVDNLEGLTDREVLRLHSLVSNELRRRGLTRTGNNPVADLAEWVAARALNLTLAEKSTTGFDARDQDGLRYEIKARRQTPTSKPTHFSAIRGIENQHFDRLVALLFAEDYSIVRASLLSFEVVKRLARFKPHVNGSLLYLRDVWAASDAHDITERCLAV
jgi:hypothetical protein